MSEANTLEQRMIKAVEELRPLIKEYNLLNVDARKGFRHQMYMKLGGFGKAIFEKETVTQLFQAAEVKVESKTRTPDAGGNAQS